MRRLRHLFRLSLRALSTLVVVGACTTCASLTPPQKAKPKMLAPAPPSEDDRKVLFELSTLLGGAPPKPHVNDPLSAVTEIGFERTQVELARTPALQQRSTTVSIRSIKARVAEIEIQFPGGCGAECARSIEAAVTQWLGPAHVVTEGNARISSFSFDTTDVVVEAYSKRASLTRIILKCRPLVAAGAGRPSILPAVGVRAAPDANPTCRELPKPRDFSATNIDSRHP